MGFISDCITGIIEGVREGLEESLIATKKRKESMESSQFYTVNILDSSDKKVVKFQINAKEPTLSMIINQLTIEKDSIVSDTKVNGNIVELTFKDEALAKAYIDGWNNR